MRSVLNDSGRVAAKVSTVSPEASAVTAGCPAVSAALPPAANAGVTSIIAASRPLKIRFFKV